MDKALKAVLTFPVLLDELLILSIVWFGSIRSVSFRFVKFNYEIHCAVRFMFAYSIDVYYCRKLSINIHLHEAFDIVPLALGVG